MMIFSLVAMIGLEKCCITSAYMEWLCHSGERTVPRGPLVCYVGISPEAKSCAGHNSHTVLDNLIIFGRDEEEDQ